MKKAVKKPQTKAAKPAIKDLEPGKSVKIKGGLRNRGN